MAKKQKQFKVGDKVSFIRINRNTHGEANMYVEQDNIKRGVEYYVVETLNNAHKDTGAINWIRVVGGEWYHPSDNFKLIKSK